MTPNAHIPTDLLTPLGAYLRLRDGAAASFLLESVEQGRLGRHSFIGSGTRLVGFEEAEALEQPVVGYLARFIPVATLAIAAVTVLVAAAIAAYFPARQAANIDPLIVLKAE